MLARATQGKLTAEKLNWWHPDVKVNFGGIATPGYGHYTMATFDAWCVCCHATLRATSASYELLP